MNCFVHMPQPSKHHLSCWLLSRINQKSSQAAIYNRLLYEAACYTCQIYEQYLWPARQYLSTRTFTVLGTQSLQLFFCLFCCCCWGFFVFFFTKAEAILQTKVKDAPSHTLMFYFMTEPLKKRQHLHNQQVFPKSQFLLLQQMGLLMTGSQNPTEESLLPKYSF